MKRASICLAILTALALTLAVALTACSKGYAITIDTDDDFNVQSCPSHAQAGETVKVVTAAVCDADVHVAVDGDESVVTSTRGGYTFVMPDHDVTVRVWFVGNGLA